MNRKSQETCDVGRFSLLQDVNPTTPNANGRRRVEGANMSNMASCFLSSPIRATKPTITPVMQNTHNLEPFILSPRRTAKCNKPMIPPNGGLGDNGGVCKKMHREEGQRQARDFDDLMDLIHRTSLECKESDLFPSTSTRPRPLSPMKKEKISIRLSVPKRPSTAGRKSQSSNPASQASTTCTPTSNSLENSQEFSFETPSSRPKPSLTDHLMSHGEKTPKSIVAKRNLKPKQRVSEQGQPPNEASRRRPQPKPVPKSLMISLEEELSDESKELKKVKTNKKAANDFGNDTFVVWRRENKAPTTPKRKLSRRVSARSTVKAASSSARPKISRRLSRRGSVEDNATNSALHEWMDSSSICSSDGVIIPDQAKIPFLSLSNSTDSLENIVERSKNSHRSSSKRGVDPILKNELRQYVKDQQHSKIMKKVMKKKLMDDIKKRTHPNLETKLAQKQRMEDFTWQHDQHPKQRTHARPPTPPLSKRKLPIMSTKKKEQDENHDCQESVSLDDLLFPASEHNALGQTDVFGNSINDLSAFDDETPDSLKWKSFR